MLNSKTNLEFLCLFCHVSLQGVLYQTCSRTQQVEACRRAGQVSMKHAPQQDRSRDPDFLISPSRVSRNAEQACSRAERGELAAEQDGQVRVCWCSRSRASSLVRGAWGPALGKGPPPPRVSAHFRICAIILQHRLALSGASVAYIGRCGATVAGVPHHRPQTTAQVVKQSVSHGGYTEVPDHLSEPVGM